MIKEPTYRSTEKATGIGTDEQKNENFALSPIVEQPIAVQKRLKATQGNF